jgi:hypothetical protein
MTMTKPRRRHARRYEKPQPCQRCRIPIIWGIVEEDGGHLRRRRDDPTRFAFVPLNATPNPRGEFAYVRGPAGRPVVREIDEPFRRIRLDVDRFTRHLDTVREER